jgi:hypothetical protein
MSKPAATMVAELDCPTPCYLGAVADMKSSATKDILIGSEDCQRICIARREACLESLKEMREYAKGFRTG